MSIKLCVIMDPITSIKPHKDTTFALLLEAQKRKYDIFYLQASDLLLDHQQVFGLVQKISVHDQPQNYVKFLTPEPQKMPLSAFNVVLMRKDPPFDNAYLYATYLLEFAKKAGCLVVNDPTGIRNANEKLFSLVFPQCCPETLVSSKLSVLREFLERHERIVVKPLDAMGGQGVFLLHQFDYNVNSILDYLTHHEQNLITAQRFIPEISSGDKRILMIDGKPYPYALARMADTHDFRANLSAGGHGVVRELSDSDRTICDIVGPVLKEHGLFFVGLDVIGSYLTEINVTSPTCVREIEAQAQVNICAEILDALTAKLA